MRFAIVIGVVVGVLVCDSPLHSQAALPSSASPFKVILLGTAGGPTINPEPPVVVERHDSADVRTRPRKDRQPIVNFVANGPPGTVPNLHGMSAREAVRTLVRLGLAAHLSGDGFVMSQDPPAGAVLEPGAVCNLVLNRWVAPSESVVQP